MFRPISELPLGKTLKPHQQGGVSQQTPRYKKAALKKLKKPD